MMYESSEINFRKFCGFWSRAIIIFRESLFYQKICLRRKKPLSEKDRMIDSTILKESAATWSPIHILLACSSEHCLLIYSFLFPNWVQRSTAYRFPYLSIDPLWFMLLNDYTYKLLTFNYSTSVYLDTKWKLFPVDETGKIIFILKKGRMLTWKVCNTPDYMEFRDRLNIENHKQEIALHSHLIWLSISKTWYPKKEMSFYVTW